MNFLIDENLSRAVARELRAAGHSAWHSADLIGVAADDKSIWVEALRRGCVIVSKDSDFVALLDAGPPQAPVVWLRLGNCSTAVVVDRLTGSLERIATCIDNGQLLIEIA